MPLNPPPFLTLPLSLRQRIYINFLVSSTPIKGQASRQKLGETYDIHTSVLRVNRQISIEAKHIFYVFNTFSISSVPPPPRSWDDEVEGSGAFEPPLQLKDLSFMRSLEVDLAYGGPSGAERYITSLSFLLTHAKSSVTQLTLTGDARPHTARDGSLDHRAFLSGFHAATSCARFQAAFAALPVKSVAVKFEFDHVRFDFNVQKEVLFGGEWSLEWLVGQVLSKRAELGLGGVLVDIEGIAEEGLEGECEEKWW